MDVIEVFADIACPFAHVGLRRFVTERERRGLDRPRLLVRAWPLELVNGKPFDGHALVAKVEALRADVVPDRFTGFDPERFPTTSLPALAGEAAARRTGPVEAEAFSLAVRDALFEHGADIGRADVVADLLADAGLPAVTGADHEAVRADQRAGVERGVVGSPHFFTDAGDFFCPSLDVEHQGDELDVTFDREGFERFLAAALAVEPAATSTGDPAR